MKKYLLLFLMRGRKISRVVASLLTETVLQLLPLPLLEVLALGILIYLIMVMMQHIEPTLLGVTLQKLLLLVTSMTLI